MNSMMDIRMSGFRLWVSSLIHWPAQQIHGKLEEAEHRLGEIREVVQADLEHRVWYFERAATAWAITALLMAVAGVFLLIGLWLGIAQLLGGVAGSFLLAATFGALASLPMLVLRKITHAHRD
jgi:hypothetical protein